MKTSNLLVHCQATGCTATNEFYDIFEWQFRSGFVHLCEKHLYTQPKTPYTKRYPKQRSGSIEYAFTWEN